MKVHPLVYIVLIVGVVALGGTAIDFWKPAPLEQCINDPCAECGYMPGQLVLGEQMKQEMESQGHYCFTSQHAGDYYCCM